MLLPDRLRDVWGQVTAGLLSQEAATVEQDRLLEGYRAQWRSALLCDGEIDLWTSLLREVAAYYGVADLGEVERRCTGAVDMLRREWQKQIDPHQRVSIESFSQSPTLVYDLM